MSAVADNALTPDPVVAPPRKPAGTMRTALRLRRTQIGLAIVIFLTVLSLFGPYIAPYGPTDPVPGQPPNAGPSAAARFGTDHIGQDVWSRFLWGGRELLVLAVISTALGLTLGTAAGLIAAYSRNMLDDILMRSMDVILAFPQIMLALVAIATVGPKDWIIVLAVGLTTMPRVARVARGASLPVIERDFVASAEAIGVPRRKILLGEIFPNILSPLLVEANLRLTYSIALITALAFLGFTTTQNGANWGSMIQENEIALTVQPWGVVLPVIAIALLTVGTGLIGDGIARAAAGIDRSRGAE